MAVNQLLVNSYATNVYLGGTNSLTNIAILRPEYVEPVKERAANHYYIDDIDRALEKGFITQQEHADTLGYKTEGSPQYRPRTLTAEEPKQE